jgi:hypothetical protein
MRLSYDQDKKLLAAARDARANLFSIPMPEYIHVNTNKFICTICQAEDIILGLGIKERDIRLWDFLKLHRFCIGVRRESRGEII